MGELITKNKIPVLVFVTLLVVLGAVYLSDKNTDGLSPRQFDGCKITGCNGQVCADDDTITTCEFLPQYACYKIGRCERQENGRCGWTPTPQLASCLRRLAVARIVSRPTGLFEPASIFPEGSEEVSVEGDSINSRPMGMEELGGPIIVEPGPTLLTSEPEPGTVSQAEKAVEAEMVSEPTEPAQPEKTERLVRIRRLSAPDQQPSAIRTATLGSKDVGQNWAKKLASIYFIELDEEEGEEQKFLPAAAIWRNQQSFRTEPISGRFLITTREDCLSSQVEDQIREAVNRAEGDEDIDQELKRSSCILNVTQDEWVYGMLSFNPNDPLFVNGRQWNLHNIGQDGGVVDIDIDAPVSWDVSTGNQQVTVAVIDSGVDYNHEDLRGNIWPNSGEVTDFINDDSDPFDDRGHGTSVAGVIGAVGNNSLGLAGVNWRIQIAPLKIFDADGRTTWTAATQAVGYAVTKGFPIINVSWGGPSIPLELQRAFEAANDAGILTIASAGNGGSDQIGDNIDITPVYPASLSSNLINIIAVAAVDRAGRLSTFSNFGPRSVQLGAPGSDIPTTAPTGSCPLCSASGYRLSSGTSFAAPHVAGAAAILWGYAVGPNSLKIRNALLDVTSPLESLLGKTLTGGLLRLRRSLEAINLLPTANAGPDQSGFAGQPIVFSGSGSDPENKPLTFNWNFGDGATAFSNSVSHTFLRPGSYTVTLTVKDVAGAIATDSMVVIVRPPIISQSAYRLFQNANSTNVGKPLAARNVLAEVKKKPFRLRLLLHVVNGDLSQATGKFKLQFAIKGSGTCAGATYSDIKGTAVIKPYDNKKPVSGNALTANVDDPIHFNHTIVNQTYNEAGAFANSASIGMGRDGKWDFALEAKTAPPRTTYCIRAVKDDGSLLDNYEIYPEVRT